MPTSRRRLRPSSANVRLVRSPYAKGHSIASQGGQLLRHCRAAPLGEVGRLTEEAALCSRVWRSRTRSCDTFKSSHARTRVSPKVTLLLVSVWTRRPEG